MRGGDSVTAGSINSPKKDVNLNRGLVQRAVYDMTVWFEIAENSIAVVEDITRSLRGSRIAHGAARFDWYGRICEQRDALLEIVTDFFRLAFKVANDTAYESASHRDSASVMVFYFSLKREPFWRGRNTYPLFWL